MRSSCHVVPRVVAVVVVSSLGMMVAFSARAAPAARVGRAAFRCERSVAARSAAFLARQLSDLGRCVGVAADCLGAAPDPDACRADARVRCERAVARVARRADALARKIAVRCGDVAADALLSPAGLGFAALAPACPALGTGQADAAVLGACLGGTMRCRGERVVASALPRAGELVRAVGVAASVRGSLACLGDRGGNGDGVRDAGDALAVARCTRTLARAAARVVGRSIANAGACARLTAACLERPAETTACLADATVACAGAFTRIAGAEQAFRRAIAARCGPSQLDFAVAAAATGVGFDALADECAAVDVDVVTSVDDLAECVVRRAACDAAALVHDATPRVDDLLALVGAGLERPYCSGSRPTATPTAVSTPAPLATPTDTAAATPTPRPTATPVGPTRTAQPGETATVTPLATSTPTRTPTPTRTVLPTPQPTSTPFCGNGVVDDGEECDGTEFDDNTCEDLCFESDPAGTLGCTARCRIDFTDCRGVDCEAP